MVSSIRLWYSNAAMFLYSVVCMLGLCVFMVLTSVFFFISYRGVINPSVYKDYGK
jgi:hypothetical protein